jgi:predicted dehydrogenase
MPYRIGIVGAGENARDHGRACQNVKQAEIAALCDISREALNQLGEEYGITSLYTDLTEMLSQEELDIVIVSTWGVHHAEVSNTVARSGSVRAILVEKPISSTAEQCEEMIAIARENQVFLTEGFKFRYHPQHIRVKEIIDTGRIGEIKSLQCTLSSPVLRYIPPSNWRYHRDRGGGSVFDTASYLIHFARHIMGSEPSCVYATGSYGESTDVELSATILLEFQGGASAALRSSYEYGYCQSTAILGTHGWIRMDLPFDQRSEREIEFPGERDLPARLFVYHDNFDTEVHRFAPVNQFEVQLAHLCDCLETGTAPLISPDFSLGNMRVIDAVFESMQTGRPTELPMPRKPQSRREQLGD